MKKWLLAAGLVLAALLGWGGWVWVHPSVLKGTSALGNFDFAPQPMGTAFYVGVAGSSTSHAPEVVTLREVAPHVSVNTAAAEVTTYICRTRGMDATGTMTDPETVSKVCSSFRLFQPGQKLRLFGGAGRDEVVLKILPTRPGHTRIDAVAFSYTRDRSHLWQRGTDVSTQDWRVTTR